MKIKTELDNKIKHLEENEINIDNLKKIVKKSQKTVNQHLKVKGIFLVSKLRLL